MPHHQAPSPLREAASTTRTVGTMIHGEIVAGHVPCAFVHGVQCAAPHPCPSMRLLDQPGEGSLPPSCPNQVAVGQHFLKIQAGDVASEYKLPGQYVQIKAADGDKPGFFAISSPPGSDGILEFLIKARAFRFVPRTRLPFPARSRQLARRLRISCAIVRCCHGNAASSHSFVTRGAVSRDGELHR